MLPSTGFVVLRSYLPERQAFALQSFLIDAGIAARLGCSSDFDGPMPTPNEVWVAAHDLAKAEELLARFRVPELPKGKNWECHVCHERNPSTFTICWKCNASPATHCP